MRITPETPWLLPAALLLLSVTLGLWNAPGTLSNQHVVLAMVFMVVAFGLHLVGQRLIGR